MLIRRMLGLEDGQKVDKRKPGHGPCCTCQKCGYDHDDCKCWENAKVEICEYVEATQAENAKLKEEKVCPKCGCKMSLWCEADVKERMDAKNRDLQKRIDEIQDENARLKALLEHSKTQLEYDELQAENAKLKKALKRYGHHDSPCAALIDDDICPCFCGFEQALKDKDNG